MSPAELWSCPPQTRLNVKSLAEALQRPVSYVYNLTRTKGIPHLKIDGELTFIASELRIWIASREERIVQQTTPITTRPRRTA